MVEKPSLKTVVDSTGLSKGYAWDILNDRQQPSRRAAIHIYRKTGWRHSLIAALTDEQIDALESVDPWSQRSEAA